MAGYSAVIHALQLKGIDGHYGNQRKVIIFSFSPELDKYTRIQKLQLLKIDYFPSIKTTITSY